jgi:putative phosphoribosyl transferase
VTAPLPPVGFVNRHDAGERLAGAVREVLTEDEQSRAVVLGIPRGGVEVAAVVADRLGADLDVVIPRKIGAPGNPELGLGAVAEGVEVLDGRLIDTLFVSEEYLRQEIAEQQDEIRRRSAAYRGERPQLDLTGQVAIVVDDGVATGGTAVAALRWARSRGADKVILAVPVAPREAVRRLEDEADRVLVIGTPEPFWAVGQWYAEFGQVPDDRVVKLLAEVRRRPPKDPG